jgi:aspartate kinase
MALIVQKYGGTSVADAACMKRVAQRVIETKEAGNQVVVVVSAMGKGTDQLVALAKEVNPRPSEREMDVLLSTGEQISIAILAMALHAEGHDAISMTGSQAGIQTDIYHTKAKITGIDPARMHQALDDGHVVIVAGFQGVNPNMDISTLGRGGSDTTAVALAAALKADLCQIYTDVDGVYTADPRIVPKASKLNEISYDEMLELASLGAKVLQSRSVEFAKKYKVNLEVLSSFEKLPGTIIKEEVDKMEDIVVRGVAVDKDQAKVTLQALKDEPGVAALVFQRLAEKQVNVDMIVQNVSEHGVTDISFTVALSELENVKKAVDVVLKEVSNEGVMYDENMAKISIVGIGMRSHAGIAHTMFKALADHGINIEVISTSEIKLSVAIPKHQADDAARVLHDAFRLDEVDQ